MFIPKCRRKTPLYGQLRPYLGGYLPQAGPAKGEPSRGGAFDAGSRAHDAVGTAEVSSIAGGGVHQGQERDPFGPGLWGAQAQLCRSAFLGQGVFLVYGRSRRRGDTSLYQEPGAGSPALGTE